MEPRGQPNEIPINIDPNAWQIVLRDGAPTLVPRRYPEPPNPTALVRTNVFQNGNPTAQSNLMISQRAYEQGLALDYASQNTPLSEEQHQFLNQKLQTLRGTIDHLARKIDERRKLTINYETNVAPSQGAVPLGSNAIVNPSLPQANVTQPHQQTHNFQYGNNNVFHNAEAQNFPATVPRQGISTESSFQNRQQGATNTRSHTINNQYGQKNSPVNPGGLPGTSSVATNMASSSGHQRKASDQGLADQRQQIFHQSQQTHVKSRQSINLGASHPYSTPQSQPSGSHPGHNSSIPQSYLQNSYQQPSASTSKVQTGVPYLNGSQEDYQTRWLNAGPVNSNQTPVRQSNPFAHAHISPMSNPSITPNRPIQLNPPTTGQSNPAQPAASSSIVPPSYPQQSQGTSRQPTVTIPPVPAKGPSAQQSSARPHGRWPYQQIAPETPTSSTAQALSVAITNLDASAFRKPQASGQALPVAAPVIPPLSWRPPLVPLPRPVPSIVNPTVPVETTVKTDVSVKDEPAEELSLAQSILQFYGKRKVMDSAGLPEPASKRRALATDVATDRHAMDVRASSVPSEWLLDSRIGSNEPMVESLLMSEDYGKEGLDEFNISETAPKMTEASTNAFVEEPTSQIPEDEVPIVLTESEGLHPDSTPQVHSTAFMVDSIKETPSRNTMEDFLRVDMISDEINVPDTSRSPSAARISSISESSEAPAQDPVPEGGQHSEAEVEGAVMVEAGSNEHQLTPVPERNLPESPLTLTDDKALEPDERGVSPLLRSPSVPLFQSLKKPGGDKGEIAGVARDRTPSEPLFLPMASSSSSDVEIVEQSTRPTPLIPTTFKGPRRRFLGVDVPFFPGFSTVRKKGKSKRRVKVSSDSGSEEESSEGEILLSARRRPVLSSSTRRQRTRVVVESSSSSDNELMELVSGTRPIFGDNGIVTYPYSVLNATPCLWANCDAVLGSLIKLVKHIEVVHIKREILHSERSETLPRCRWDGCRRRSYIWCDEGGSKKFLRHVVRHIGPEESCMIAGCTYSTEDREEFRRHCEVAHKDAENLTLKASTLPNIVPREPTQALPDFAPASEALFLPIYGDPTATLRSRPPSPQASSQAMSTMPLSPTKHGPRWRETEERTADEYSFLDPFYPPSLYMDDLGKNAMRLFGKECHGIDIGNVAKDPRTKGRPMSDEP